MGRFVNACIILYSHSNGAHYAALRWDARGYDIYNDKTGFSSIENYMNAVDGTFISIWCIA